MSQSTSVNQELLRKFQKASLDTKIRLEGDGHEVLVEVREDEEQTVKLQEIIDLLVAAGYFRARIKGLSPFDKVIGGMTWCIESFNVDVDVDLLFQENSTIGQQIALSEKIVAVLPKIKCPHRIEPHQIQGLDFIHIFPVIQWLVKVSLEAREAESSYMRCYAENQFEKNFSIEAKNEQNAKVMENLEIVKDFYTPRRYFKRKNAPPPDLLSRVQITLLEYGFKGGKKSKPSSSVEKEIEIDQNQPNNEQIEDEQNNIDQLIANLIVAKEDILNDSDISEQDKEILIKHYKTLHSELKDGGIQVKQEEKLEFLQEQNKLLENSITALLKNKTKLKTDIENEEKSLNEICLKVNEANKTLNDFKQLEAENPSTVKEIEDLIKLNDSLKSEEAQYKENCKKEMTRLENEISEFKENLTVVNLTPEEEAEANKIKEKIKSVRLQIAKKNQSISKLERQIDDVPNRAEMNQYQTRFLELYNQVAAKHKETKQYYTLYNTLEDKRRYMQKELSLLNSIGENYPTAMESARSKDEFLEQFHKILEGVKQNRMKIESQLSDQKRKRDQLSNTQQNLLELQRSYASAIKELAIECRNYEVLSANKEK